MYFCVECNPYLALWQVAADTMRMEDQFRDLADELRANQTGLTSQVKEVPNQVRSNQISHF